MEELVKSLLGKLFPALEAGTQFPRWGVITRIAGDVTTGAVADDDEPRYAVDVQPLKIDEVTGKMVPDGSVIYPSVPLPAGMAGNGRGQFGFPPSGTRVLLQFVQGLPSHPVITGIYPVGRNLPALGSEETLLQHSSATFLRSTSDEDWQLQARNKLWLGTAHTNLVTEVRRLAALFADHVHPGTGKASNASEGKDVATNVASIEK